MRHVLISDHAASVPLSAITSGYLAWMLGRSVVVLERRGATWRAVRQPPAAALSLLTS